MTIENSGDVYRNIGVRPAISASGTSTRYGGSKLRNEVMEAMNKAATVMVDMDELNRAAGTIIAKHTGAEAGLVTSGSAGGLLLQAVAVIAGSDPGKVARLPDTQGMKNEIIIHKSHRFPYDNMFSAAGAKLVDFGDGRRCDPWQLEAAFTERTVAVAYLKSPFVSRSALPLEQVCEIAHAHDVPVLVDAASFLPPRANLRRFTAEGADMVVYSGGKGIRGPQGTGILCGREELIDAAFAAASPHRFIARAGKVAKEEIIGLIHALEVFVSEDEEAETQRYRAMGQQVVDALIEIPGIDVNVKHNQYDYLIPTAVIEFTTDWKGLAPTQVISALATGDQPIFLSTIGNPDEPAVHPLNLSDQELETVIRRLREELVKAMN